MTDPRLSADYVVSFDDAEDARSAIFQALGAATVCWSKLHRNGVFESERACAIGEALIARLADFGLQIDGRDDG